MRAELLGEVNTRPAALPLVVVEAAAAVDTVVLCVLALVLLDAAAPAVTRGVTPGCALLPKPSRAAVPLLVLLLPAPTPAPAPAPALAPSGAREPTPVPTPDRAPDVVLAP